MAKGSDVDEARAPGGREGFGTLKSYALIVAAGENDGWKWEPLHDDGGEPAHAPAFR